ncbi:hypothetical protein BT96DRAFT_1092095 [Gymnopus androsaceus JB14]|uniref:CxC2-like cysteine cluster KDZ transposase-associated domain-containing protein n=1 Tax=Gymnopus androsaceus JB14 TaxID=1447944 RepID=A0A6A4GJ37_9AGAR|nr:hypothetical protein BT96DRAFT_1092095 [Gymnopus androsaceus JB14]
MRQWAPYRNEYLAEMLRAEGRGDRNKNFCYACGCLDQEHALVFCCISECFSKDLVCEECCRKHHWNRPLDIVERWNGSFFERIALRDIGIVVQIGHCPGKTCLSPSTYKDFIVIHTNGLHRVHVAFCNCFNKYSAGERKTQLLRWQWYPATHLEPQTAATFEVLNHFHLLTLQGKVTAYDYYAGLEKLSNNVGEKGPVGQGNNSHRLVADTKSGELAVQCIACPKPGVNLPDDWQQADKKFFFKYFLYLAEDCCFCLKRRLVSSEVRDPGLGTGSSYFVEDEPYQEFLKGVTDQHEMSTCTGLAALDHTNTKFSQGYATTSVGLSVCACHEFVMPNSVVDLQKGERYMIFKFLVQSYDIVCQWSRNLCQHMKSMPALVKENWPPKSLLFVVPKMHLPRHIRSYMGPGNRHEVLNDHFGHWSWRKLTGLGA